MKTSKESRVLARQMFRASLVKGRLDAGTAKRLVDLVAEKKPRGYIATLEAFARLVAAEQAKHHALVEVATDLPPATLAKIDANLKSRHGEDLTTEFKVMPELLGGLRVRIGDHVWDGTLKNRLERLAEQF